MLVEGEHAVAAGAVGAGLVGLLPGSLFCAYTCQCRLSANGWSSASISWAKDTRLRFWVSWDFMPVAAAIAPGRGATLAIADNTLVSVVSSLPSTVRRKRWSSLGA